MRRGTIYVCMGKEGRFSVSAMEAENGMPCALCRYL
jgi:hypothetical protein